MCADRFWVGNGGLWSDNVNHWSDTSGGAPGASKPTSADNVYFDANSFTAEGQTVTINENAYCLDMDWTGATNTPTLGGSSLLNFYGSVNLSEFSSLNHTGNWYVIRGSGAATINMAGLTKPAGSLNVWSGNITLTSDLNIAGDLFVSFNALGGFFDTNGYDVTVNNFYSSDYENLRSISFGDSVITCAALAFVATNLTFDAGTSTIIMTGNSKKTFNGGGLTYNNVRFSGTPTTVTGDNTFNVLTIAPGKTVKFTSGSIQTITKGLDAFGTIEQFINLESTEPETPFVITKESGIVKVNYCSIKDCDAVGGASFQAASSNDGGGNFGWEFVNHKLVAQIKDGELYVDNRLVSNVKYKKGVFQGSELNPGEVGIDTSNHRQYLKYPDGTVKYVELS